MVIFWNNVIIKRFSKIHFSRTAFKNFVLTDYSNSNLFQFSLQMKISLLVKMCFFLSLLRMNTENYESSCSSEKYSLMNKDVCKNSSQFLYKEYWDCIIKNSDSLEVKNSEFSYFKTLSVISASIYAVFSDYCEFVRSSLELEVARESS